jgi:signal transduction histidine kinase
VKFRLIGALVTVAVLILLVFSVPLASFVARVERERLVTALERDAFILAGHAKETLNTTAGAVLPSLQPYVDSYSKSSDARIVVTNSDGLVVSTSDPSIVFGTDFSNRLEVAGALKGVPSVGERDSATLGERLLFVAVPVLLGDTVLGVVRFSNPKSVVDKEVQGHVMGIVAAGLITLLAAACVAIPLALTIARPISRLKTSTESLADGDFSVHADDTKGPPEVRELSRSFNAMAGRIGLMLENQQHFSGAVSHQLRTPLTALRLRLDQAQEAVGDSTSPVAMALDASRVETDRLQEMIEQLLALSRLEGGSSITATVNAAVIVRSRVAVWESLAAERYITLKIVGLETAPCVALDGALEQIVDNYIDNALTAAPDNSIITVEVHRVQRHIQVDVIDEGPGLTEEKRSLAFDRFWRGTDIQNAPGTGLGLAIVRQLAVASGGVAELLPRTDGKRGLVARISLLAR